jgi:hypothetical protein
MSEDEEEEASKKMGNGQKARAHITEAKPRTQLQLLSNNPLLKAPSVFYSTMNLFRLPHSTTFSLP